MTTELQDATAALIAELPDDVGKMTLPNLEALIALEERLGEALGSGGAATGEIARLVAERGCGDKPVYGYLTEEEIAVWEGRARHLLDAERANAALQKWNVRAGSYKLMGIEPPEPTMTITEDPDGSLVFIVPKREDR